MNSFTSELSPSDLIVWRDNEVAQYLKNQLKLCVVTSEDEFWQHDYSNINRLVVLKELSWKEEDRVVDGRKMIQDWSLNFYYWPLPISFCSIVDQKHWCNIENLDTLFERPSELRSPLLWTDMNAISHDDRRRYFQILTQLFTEVNHKIIGTHDSSIYAIIGEFDYRIQTGELKKAYSIHQQSLKGKLALLKVCLQKSKLEFDDHELYYDLFQKEGCLIDLINILLINADTLLELYSAPEIHELVVAIQDQYLFKNTLLNQTILQHQTIE